MKELLEDRQPTKLVGTSRDGDAIHAGQQMATEEGFKNVSQIWLGKTKSYEEGLQALEEGKAQTEDLLLPITAVRPELGEGNMVVFKADGRSFRPTEHALDQIATWAGCGTQFVQKLAVSPENAKGKILFLRDEGDAKTLIAVLRNGFRRLDPKKPFLWRTRSDGTLRAMLSDQYKCVDNRWLLESLSQIIPSGRLSHWKGDSDTIYGNILIPDTIRAESDSEYGGMLSTGNSEIGERKLTSIPSIFRAICMNGCIWGAETGVGIKKIHRGNWTLQEVFLELKENLQKQIPLLPQGIERLLSTRRMAWDGDSMLPLFAQVAGDYRLSRRQATQVLRSYLEERAASEASSKTLFGVVNAVTRTAQSEVNAEWVRLDTIGGQLAGLDENRWGALKNRAKALGVKQVEASFAASN